jgi:hypothetical protein
MSTLRRSSSSYGAFADGIIIRGVPLLTLYPGNVYWVDSNGGGGSKGTFAHPVATLSEAHDLVTTDNGDIIAIKPGHAETLTSTLDFSKSGFAIIGLGFGDNRPTFTNGITAAGDDYFDFAGDDIVVYNLKYKEAAPAGSAVVVFNVSGDFFTIENCYIELGAKTLTFLTHDTTAKKGLTILNNTIIGTAAGPDVGIRVEKTHLYAYISGNRWMFDQSAGIDTGCVVFVSGTTAAGEHIIEKEIAGGFADSEVYLLQTDVQSMSIMKDLLVVGADATDNCGASPASGFAFFNNFSLEEGKGLPAAIDVQGVRPINTTPAS